MRLQLKSMPVVLNQEKYLNSIVLLYNLTVFLEVAQEGGLLLAIYLLHLFSSLVIFGMGLELFLGMFSLVLILIQKNKQSLELFKSWVIKLLKNNQFKIKYNFLFFKIKTCGVNIYIFFFMEALVYTFCALRSNIICWLFDT